MMLLVGPTVCLEMFENFPLFDKTFRHIELCNRFISHIQRNPPKLVQQCGCPDWLLYADVPEGGGVGNHVTLYF